MIDTIVFDMGQVLIRWTGALLLEQYGLSEEDHALLLRELFGDVEWPMLDHGTISFEAAAEAVCRRVPEHLHGIVRELVTGWWHQPMRPIPGMADLVRELKDNGYGIYLLSNASTALRGYFPRIPGSECFDGLMVSAEEKLLKPQHEIYERLYERFGLVPEQCVFIDDSPANIEGAMLTGMQGIVFRGDTERLLRELLALGIGV